MPHSSFIRCLICLFVVLPAAATRTAADTKAKKVKATVLVEGVHCDDCLRAVRERLARLKEVRFEPDDIYRGEKPKYFSDPFVVQLGRSEKAGLGALAKATASSHTPHREDLPPRLHLVLYADAEIDEPSVSSLRMALMDITGVLVLENGGLGGVPSKRLYWIRLSPDGSADLTEIVSAAKQAVKFKLLDPDQQPR